MEDMLWAVGIPGLILGGIAMQVMALRRMRGGWCFLWLAALWLARGVWTWAERG